MKKVAATSGQSVSLAMLFFAEEIAGEGIRAGRDKELNFYSRPPKGNSLSRCGQASSHSQNTRVICACKGKMGSNEVFFSVANRTFVLFASLSLLSRGLLLGFLLSRHPPTRL
jgi:hypothetical protein